MADVVSIDAARVRVAARTLCASAEGLDGAMVAECGFGRGDSDESAPRERAVREGYLRLARAIGVWGAAADTTGRTLLGIVDAYEQQDAIMAGDVAGGG